MSEDDGMTPTLPPSGEEDSAPAVHEVYRFREMENMRKAKVARVIYRLGEFRKCVLEIGPEWYEEKYDRKTGLVTYHLCSPERRAEILEQVSK